MHDQPKYSTAQEIEQTADALVRQIQEAYPIGGPSPEEIETLALSRLRLLRRWALLRSDEELWKDLSDLADASPFFPEELARPFRLMALVGDVDEASRLCWRHTYKAITDEMLQRGLLEDPK